LEYRHFEPKCIKITLYCCYSLEIGISFDHVKITAKKAQYILAEGIEVYADDVDEYFLELPESVAVLKIREPGNFCFRDRKWCYSDRTGKKI